MEPPVSHDAHSTGPSGLLMVDDHELVRLGLRTLILSMTSDTGHNMHIFEASTLDEALHLYNQHAQVISLVLLDLHLPDAFGLTGLTRFLERFPNAHIVVLSATNDPVMKRQALQCGARDYLTKSGNLHEVVAYIRMLNPAAADLHNAMLSRKLPDDDGDDHGKTNRRLVRASDGQVFHLTTRQAQVLDWILSGQSNREIAAQTCLSEGTVKNHVSALLLLVGVRSRAQLISQLR